MSVEKIGPLDCLIVGDLASAEVVAVFCHGFGAPGDDLVPLAREIMNQEQNLASKAAFVFPEAPLSLDHLGMPGGRAWWEINMMRLQQLLQTQQIDKLISAEPPGLTEARELYSQFLQALREKYELRQNQLVLGGFSQGAMLTMDYFLRTEEQPAGLVLYSGTVICLDEWTELVAEKTKLPILQTHGTEDPILPFAAAVILTDLLNAHGQDVEFQEFPGGHTITYDGLVATAKLINSFCTQ